LVCTAVVDVVVGLVGFDFAQGTDLFLAFGFTCYGLIASAEYYTATDATSTRIKLTVIVVGVSKYALFFLFAGLEVVVKAKKEQSDDHRDLVTYNSLLGEKSIDLLVSFMYLYFAVCLSLFFLVTIMSEMVRGRVKNIVTITYGRKLRTVRNFF